MKKIIKGKLYDTETAKRIATHYASCGRSDFHYYEEELYLKRTGEYFLYGSGNAASKYSKSCGMNEWCGSEEIVPLTYSEANEWAEEHMDADDYIAAFGIPDEDEEQMHLHVRISPQAGAKLKQAAAQSGITIGEQIERWIMGAE